MTNPEPNSPFTVSYPPKEKKTLKREIKRTWQWLVFSWHNLKRIGGIKEIVSTLTTTAIILIQRTWRQQQYKRRLKKLNK